MTNGTSKETFVAVVESMFFLPDDVNVNIFAFVYQGFNKGMRRQNAPKTSRRGAAYNDMGHTSLSGDSFDSTGDIRIIDSDHFSSQIASFCQVLDQLCIICFAQHPSIIDLDCAPGSVCFRSQSFCCSD